MQDKLETRTFLFFLLVVSCVFMWILKPFFGAIFWACAIAVIFYPTNEKLLKRWPNSPNLVALSILLLCLVVLILPLIFVILSVVDEGNLLYEKLQSGELNPANIIEIVSTEFPTLPNLLSKIGIDINTLKTNALSTALSSGKYIAQHAFSIGQDAFSFVLSLTLMLYITFFMLRDGKKLVEVLVHALPLGDARERLLFALFAEVTRATIKGNVVIAIVQGLIGGITLWALDVHAAILWGVLMTLASLIPAVGSALVWVPISVYLVATGDVTSALILTGIGAGVIGVIDNLLRPLLVGRDTKLPDYLVLLSTLGGIAIFGINGFVIGPLIAALFIAFWRIFIDEVQVLAPNKNLPEHLSENENNES